MKVRDHAIMSHSHSRRETIKLTDCAVSKNDSRCAGAMQLEQVANVHQKHFETKKLTHCAVSKNNSRCARAMQLERVALLDHDVSI